MESQVGSKSRNRLCLVGWTKKESGACYYKGVHVSPFHFTNMFCLLISRVSQMDQKYSRPDHNYFFQFALCYEISEWCDNSLAIFQMSRFLTLNVDAA